MAKRKTWIKVKRGMLEPKHRVKLGIRIWLYLHILDRADWGSGTVLEWVDESEAEVLGISIDTLRKQRRKLRDDGYITTIQKKHSQQIIIHNWTNPRKYDGKEINKGSKKTTPSKETKGGNSTQGLPEGLPLGLPEGYSAHDNPPLDSQVTNHKSQKNKRGDRPAAVELCKRIIFRYPHKSLWKTIDRQVGNEFVDLLRWGRILRKWRLSNFNITNYKGMLENFNRERSQDNNLDYESAAHRRSYTKGWFDD